MNLYLITLPCADNTKRVSTELQQKEFERFLGEWVGGFTKLPLSYGYWFDSEDEDHGPYVDSNVSYQVMCGPENWSAIVAKAFDLWSDQKAIFHAQIGTAQVEYRQPAMVAAE